MHSRNAGLQRLRSITKRVGVAAAVLTGVFAGLAAAGNSGKHHRRTAARTQAPPAPAQPARVPAPPSLPPASGDEGSGFNQTPTPTTPAQTPSPPQQAPAPTQAPPASVSGGS